MDAFNPVGWFEIPATDLDRAKAFYEGLLGVTLELHDMGELKMAWFPIKESGKGAAGSLVKNEWYAPRDNGTLVYFTAPDLDATLAKVEALGGKVMIPKKDIGDYGAVGIIVDTEGNRVGLHSAGK